MRYQALASCSICMYLEASEGDKTKIKHVEYGHISLLLEQNYSIGHARPGHTKVHSCKKNEWHSDGFGLFQRIYNWKPLFFDKFLESSIGRGLGVLKMFRSPRLSESGGSKGVIEPPCLRKCSSQKVLYYIYLYCIIARVFQFSKNHCFGWSIELLKPPPLRRQEESQCTSTVILVCILLVACV